MTAGLSDSLRVSLEVPPEVRLGRPVPIAIRLENQAAQRLDLYLRGRTIAFDVVITGEGGDTVWQRLADEIIPAIVQLKTLQPREVLELKAEWHQRDNRGVPVAPGSFQVRGAVLTDGPVPFETEPATLRLLPE